MIAAAAPAVTAGIEYVIICLSWNAVLTGLYKSRRDGVSDSVTTTHPPVSTLNELCGESRYAGAWNENK